MRTVTVRRVLCSEHLTSTRYSPKFSRDFVAVPSAARIDIYKYNKIRTFILFYIIIYHYKNIVCSTAVCIQYNMGNWYVRKQMATFAGCYYSAPITYVSFCFRKVLEPRAPVEFFEGRVIG